jgi:FKBP-type peptidyl-prolyl cis-trans isomerase 2
MHKGDFLLVEYVGRIKASNEIFDLTDGKLADREGIRQPGHRYGPQLIIMGSGMAVPGLEKQVTGMKPGEERRFELKPDEAFGRREPKLIKVLSFQRFIKQKVNPVPGAFVNIEGRNARIQAVSGGRVRVDFNSPLAGKEILYRVKLVKRLSGTLEKAKALLEHYGLDAEVSFKEGELSIKTKNKLNDSVKSLLNRELSRWLKDAKKITYVSPKKS